MSIASQNPSSYHPSWLGNVCTNRKDPESEWLAKDNPEINPITIKPKTASHMAEQFSWVPLPYCSPPGCPFSIKSLALSARVSLDNSFPSVRQEPVPGALKEGIPLPTTLSVEFQVLRMLWMPISEATPGFESRGKESWRKMNWHSVCVCVCFLIFRESQFLV